MFPSLGAVPDSLDEQLEGFCPFMAAVVLAGLHVNACAACTEVLMVAKVPLRPPPGEFEYGVHASTDTPSKLLLLHWLSIPRVQR